MKNLSKFQMVLIYGGENGDEGNDDGPSSVECGLAAVGCFGVGLMFGIATGPLGGALAGAGCYQAMEYGGC